MTLGEWQQRWHLPREAIAELAEVFSMTAPANFTGGASESAVQSRVRLEAAQKGIRLWRNNVGAGTLENGSHLRWGLGNESARVNAVIKSADLIGLRPRLIIQQDVGTIIGQFVSREVKAEGWKWTGTDRELAQLKWATLVNQLGGDASIVNCEGSL